MNKTIAIHHSADFDGIFCREIAKKFLPDAEVIGWDYGNPAPVVPDDCNLYMLDISIEGLMGHPNLIWIDHHKSAIEKFGPKPGFQIDGVAACRLAWQYFSPGLEKIRPDHKGFPSKQDFIDRKVTEPIAVRLAGEYDIWDKRDPDAELFQHGLRSRELGPDTWDILLSGPTAPEGNKQGLAELYVDTLLDAGEALQYARTKENASIIKEMGFTLNWEGLTFLGCNAARYNSHLFTAGLTPEHDACFGFKWTGKDWSVSLYHAPGKEHHDLSVIAVKHGGGGHRGACGFRMRRDELLRVICNDNEKGQR